MSTDNTKTLPLLSLRNLVLFPGAVMPVEIGRASSLRRINPNRSALSMDPNTHSGRKQLARSAMHVNGVAR